jgi:hypothetical protein
MTERGCSHAVAVSRADSGNGGNVRLRSVTRQELTLKRVSVALTPLARVTTKRLVVPFQRILPQLGI